MIAAIEQLNDALGPAYTEDEKVITIVIAHDRGMRFKSLVRQESRGLSSDILPDGFDEKPFYDYGDYVHEMRVQNTIIKWKARCIRLRLNEKQYI
nr:hypothetical protein [Methylorubrum zatmanii]